MKKTVILTAIVLGVMILAAALLIGLLSSTTVRKKPARVKRDIPTEHIRDQLQKQEDEATSQLTELNKTKVTPVHFSVGNTTRLSFDISWPLIDSTDTNIVSRPLLRGILEAQSLDLNTDNARIAINISLIRPSKARDRSYWNRKLIYREYDWMNRVRVWDKKNKWLYPNLAYLFKLHGADREERYGGWDKGHNVDNDFGAVLIRNYDEDGAEHSDTKDRPLVSAGWHPDSDDNSDKYTIVHRAKSDNFTIHMSPEQTGRVKVWLIYADFMRNKPPASWPTEPEVNGGILSFFNVEWKRQPDKTIRITISNDTPETGTDFAWETWVNRSYESDIAEGKAVLCNRADNCPKVAPENVTASPLNLSIDEIQLLPYKLKLPNDIKDLKVGHQFERKSSKKARRNRTNNHFSGFVVTSIEEKFENKTTLSGQKMLIDVSEVTIQRGDKVIVLVKGVDTEHVEHVVHIVDNDTGKTYKVHQHEEFTVGSHKLRLISVDRKKRSCVLVDTTTSKTILVTAN